jgi:hypothetical protein
LNIERPTSNIQHRREAAMENEQPVDYRKDAAGGRKFDLQERLLEADELIRIFVVSIRTATKNMLKEGDETEPATCAED